METLAGVVSGTDPGKVIFKTPSVIFALTSSF
jgi:hypothetical protein